MRNKIRFNFLKYWDFLKTHVLAVLFKGAIHKLLKQMRGRGFAKSLCLLTRGRGSHWLAYVSKLILESDAKNVKKFFVIA